jgi:ABC-type uncharacterized transport system substrate-binding protein
MARLMHEVQPNLRRVGTLFSPAELNSCMFKDMLQSALKEYGIELTALPVSSSGEITMAAEALCHKNIQAVCQIIDNATNPAFHYIARQAAENNLPVYAFERGNINKGAALCLGRDYYQAGIEAGLKAARVLKGESPGAIPFSNATNKELLINRELAACYNLKISPEMWEENRKDLSPTKSKQDGK